MRFSDSYLLWAGIAFLANFGSTAAEGSKYGSFHTKPRDYDARDYYALQLDGRDPEVVAKHFGLQHEGVIGELKGHHLFSTEKDEPHVDVVKRGIEHFQARRRKREPIPVEEMEVFESIKLHQKQQLKQLRKRLPPPPRKDWQPKRRQDVNSLAAGVGRPVDSSLLKLQKIQKAMDIEDPIFKDQWHLLNYKSPGHDVNVTGLWLEGITGHNATVSIVDDGLDMYSNDLKDNYFAAGSYDFNDHQSEPRPRLSDDRHGTRCAGEIAAVKNDVCGVGVAYDAKVSGIRILSKLITDADEAVALNYAFNDNHIYSCSWGPPDDGQAMDEPGILIKRAIVNGINEGRNGKGSVFVFATGNGANVGDNCNFDGYTNSIYSITVGAIDHKGLHPYYSEQCSAQLVVTYSSGSGEAIHTTDVSQGGSDKCYSKHGGTSAAAPLAAGIYALVLSVRPDLTWRDLQYLTVDTAIPVEEDDEDWITTKIGKKYNHKFGYGKLDAYRIVHAAKDFKSVKPQAWYHSPVLTVGQAIPLNEGLVSTYTVTKEMLQKANLEKIEHVTVKMNVKHQRRGDISVDLVSPNGIVSKIAVTRQDDASKTGYKDWTFMSVVHWGEDGLGEWKIITRDNNDNGKDGTLDNWQLNLWGPSIDPAKAVKHPLPGDKEHDDTTDNNHSASTSVAPVHTTTLAEVAKPVVPTKPATEPSVERPVNAKPAGLSGSKPAEKPAAPTPTGEKAAESQAATDETKRPGMIPSFLPTFGVSGTKQAWIYASAAFIGLFVAGLGIFMCVQKRKNAKNNSRDDYEFAVLENEEEMLTAGGKEKGTKKKARDLYDAFGASDDEDVLSDSDDEMGEKNHNSYRDVDSDDDSDSHGSPSSSR